jgi:hypothetical protein
MKKLWEHYRYQEKIIIVIKNKKNFKNNWYDLRNAYIVKHENSDNNDDDYGNVYCAWLFLRRFNAKQMKYKLFAFSDTPSLRQSVSEGRFEVM